MKLKKCTTKKGHRSDLLIVEGNVIATDPLSGENKVRFLIHSENGENFYLWMTIGEIASGVTGAVMERVFNMRKPVQTIVDECE